MGRERALAWVESPLQLVAAAEYANAADVRLDVAMRISGPQMPATAHALIERRAPFASVTPYYGIPWSQLSSQRHWVVGDALSGQFQLAMATLGARAVSLVDDGMMTIRVARGLVEPDAFSRPGEGRSGTRTLLASMARERLLARAARDALDVFTVFGDHEAVRALTARGIPVSDNTFAWTRATGRPVSLPSSTVVLGAAAVVDGTLARARYLDWVADVVRNSGSVSYLPHRREPADLVAAVGAVPGVHVIRTGLPVELALAGTTDALDIVSLPSTAAVTLRTVLAGSGSTVRTDRVADPVR